MKEVKYGKVNDLHFYALLVDTYGGPILTQVRGWDSMYGPKATHKIYYDSGVYPGVTGKVEDHICRQVVVNDLY